MIQNTAASHFKMRYTDNLASVAFWMASQFVLSVWPPAGNEVTKQSLFFYQIFHSFLTFTYWEFILCTLLFLFDSQEVKKNSISGSWQVDAWHWMKSHELGLKWFDYREILLFCYSTGSPLIVLLKWSIRNPYYEKSVLWE